MFRAKNIPVLMYHHISHRPGLVTLSPDTFREHMKWLAKTGWNTITSKEMEHFYQGGKLPRKSVMLTFDDGYLDNWFHVYPVLKEFNLRAHIFLITDLIGDGPVRDACIAEYSHHCCDKHIMQGKEDKVMLRWSEVNEMLKDGLIEFHVHTHSHTRWDKIFRSNNKQLKYLRQDIIQSKKCLTERTGQCSKHLCWPEGYYNKDYINVAEELGFSYLYTTERRMNCPDKGSLQIGRISTKEREYTSWLKIRLFCYTTPLFSSILALHKGPRVSKDIEYEC